MTGNCFDPNDPIDRELELRLDAMLDKDVEILFNEEEPE